MMKEKYMCKLSRFYQNIIGQIKQNNVYDVYEDVYTLKNYDKVRRFSEGEIKITHNNTTNNYTQNTHNQHTKKMVQLHRRQNPNIQGKQIT